jgi:hypothetical protein
VSLISKAQPKEPALQAHIVTFTLAAGSFPLQECTDRWKAGFLLQIPANAKHQFKFESGINGARYGLPPFIPFRP